MPTGVVTNLYRDGDPQDPGSPTPYVEASIAGVGSGVPCRYYGNPPPPLSVCEFTDMGGIWFCEGPKEYDLRQVLHEDFTICPTATADGTIACDTSWLLDINGAGSQVAQNTGSALGAALLTGGAASSRYSAIYKTAGAFLVGAADAFWVTVRMQPSETSLTTIQAGLTDYPTASDAIRAVYAPAVDTNWRLNTTKDTTSTAISTAVAGAVQYFTLDLVLVAGTFGAIWVDGDGPYVKTDNVPDTADTLQPFAIVTSGTTATRSVSVDYLTVTAINGDLAHPTEHPLLV